MMDYKVFFISSFDPIDQEKGSSYLKSLGVDYMITESNDKSWIIYAEPLFAAKIIKYPRFFFEAFGPRTTMMISHNDGPLARFLSSEALSFFSGSIAYLPEVILKNASFGKYDFVPLLANEFKGVDETLLLTMREYLLSELRADIASEHLYIHRNTFAYRLKKFKKDTGLDMSSYHDCLLLELFFQFTHVTLPRYN